jgi:hypothetical protein
MELKMTKICLLVLVFAVVAAGLGFAQETAAVEIVETEIIGAATVTADAETVAGDTESYGGHNGNMPGIVGGRFLINAGIGYAAQLYKITLPPISASAEYAFPKIPLSAGAYFGILRTENNSGLSICSDSLMAIGVKASWHFDLIRNLDSYAGLILGLLVLDQRYDFSELLVFTPDAHFDLRRYSLFYGFNIGARYFFTNNIGAYMELGYNAISVTSIGLSLKF